MLTPKEKAKLKSFAMKDKCIFQVGKSNLSENLIDGLNQALESRELIKINLLKTIDVSKEEICSEITNKTNSSLVEIKGNTAVLYRKNKKNKFNI